MARYSAFLMLVSLNIEDTPLWYQPPRGPAVEFKMTYNQKDDYTQPDPGYSNFGPNWTFDWFTYITDNGTTGSRDKLSRYASGGGMMYHTNYNSGTGLYDADIDGNVLHHIASGGSDSYELTMPDGSKQVFGQPAAWGTQRRLYLTAIKDPAGNVLQLFYDTLGRISYVVDSLSQTNYLYYDLPVYPPYLQYRITGIEDPFGRTADFEYDSSGMLIRITDMGGISSAFEYKPGWFAFIQSMTTPYGTSTFNYHDDGTGTGPRWLTMTDPDGGTELVYFREDKTVQDIGASPPVPVSPVPGLEWGTGTLLYRNTFYFDKKAYQMSGNGSDYNYATIYHWEHLTDGVSSGNLESLKRPLENRIWFLYPGQLLPEYCGGVTLRQPSVIAQVVDDPNNPANYLTQTNQFGFNSQGMVTNFIDTLGRRITLDYYPNGLDLQKARQTTGVNNDVLAEFGTYDAQHHPSSYTNAARQTYNFLWNTNGQLTNVINPRSEITRLNYDTNGYLQNIQRFWSGGTKTTFFGYDGCGRVCARTNSDNYALNYTYDDLDRLTKVTYPDQTFEKYDYDRLDLVRVQDRTRHQIDITYDNVGRPVTLKDRLGQTNRFSWCSCGGLESITDPLGHATTWIRDVEGRVTQKVYTDNTSTYYNYSSRSDRLVSVTDAENQIKHYLYYPDDTLTNVSYTSAKVATPSVSFTYDLNYLRMTNMTDGTGTTAFDYYPVTSGGGTLGALRLHTVDGPLANDTITYQYDALGRMTNWAVNTVNESVAYDDLGRITNHTSVLGPFAYGYVNDTRRLSSVAYPNGQATVFDYFDNLGDRRLKEIWNKNVSGATISRFDYVNDVLGRITQWKQQADTGTPQVMSLDYDNEDQLLGALITPQGQAGIKNNVYGYDAAGNRASELIETAGANPPFTVTTSTYNGVNELTNRSGSGPFPVRVRGTINEPATATVNGQTATMTQDPNSTSNGKIFTKTLTMPSGNNPIQVIATDFASPTPHVTTSNYTVNVVGGEGKTFSYDANGNLTNAVMPTATNSYAWDAENRLATITQFITNHLLTSQFTYDGFGRRVQIVETMDGATTSTRKFVWSGTDLCQERSVNNLLKKRFFAEGEQMNGVNNYYFTRDHLGSIREMTDSGGAVRARYDYDPYGRRTKISGDLEADFGFTGYYVHAPSGLQLALYRAYDTDLGRFINRDPIGEEGGINLYDYVQNDPVNEIDPLGLDDADDILDRFEKNNNSGNYTQGGARWTPQETQQAANDVKGVGVDAALILAGAATGGAGELGELGDATEAANLAKNANKCKNIAKEAKAVEAASEATAKSFAKQIGKDLGKDAQREFHDMKTGPDRSLAQLKEDAATLYQEAGKTPPKWMR